MKNGNSIALKIGPLAYSVLRDIVQEENRQIREDPERQDSRPYTEQELVEVAFGIGLAELERDVLTNPPARDARWSRSHRLDAALSVRDAVT